MSNKYRKNTNSALFKDKGFIIVLIISLLMVLLAGYLAATWNQDATVQNDPSDSVQTGTEPYSGEAVDFNNEESDVNVVQGDDANNADVLNPQEGITEPTTPTEAPTGGAETTIVSYIWPCEGNIVKEYSGLSPVFSETLQDWRTHSAIDFQTGEAQDVLAAADGVVEDVYTDGLMGVSILLKHEDGMYTLYQSLSEEPKVLKNMEVKQGDVIGKTGNTATAEETEGTHLHFAMILNGSNCDPNSYIKTN